MPESLRVVVQRTVACLAAVLAYAVAGVEGPPVAPGPRLSEAPPNTWVKLLEEVTGYRAWPMFYFDRNLNEFVLTAGEARKQPHFDTEFFDLKTLRWVNAYPAGAPYKSEAGPTDALSIDIRENEPGLKADKNGVMRILRALNPYCRDPGAFHQYAYCPDDGKLYTYFQDGTLAFDPKQRLWTDLKVPRFSQCQKESWLIYGALAYDPINKELMSIGGTSDEDGGTPGTWLFSLGGGAWRKLSPGSKELRKLSAEAKELHARMAAFINACRNRFYVTEDEAEAKADLAAGAKGIAGAAHTLVERLRSAKPTGLEADAPKMAMANMEPVGPGFRALSGKLAGAIAGETLVEAQGLLETVERAERALDVEPCGRAASPAVTCGDQGKIVLFGGCRMDSYLADTWVYDCKSRTWEQRWPTICPAPRAGHVLARLPKSGKVLLYGGVPFSSPYHVPHQSAQPTQDLWSYDVAANEWKRLAAPAKDCPVDAVGAVDDNDVLVAMGRQPKNDAGRVTWALKADPGKASAEAEQGGVAAGTVATVFDTPKDFDRVSKPDPDSNSRLLRELPANQWTPMPAPPKKVNPHPWGTCPYDTVRHQLLSFGGGHSAAHYTDVAHYSLRTATWSWGYGEEYPFANASFKAMFNQTFKNRPTTPTHVWDGAAFDEASGKAVFCVRRGTWVYDPVSREWEYPPVWQNGGGIEASMKGTPKGVVYWDVQGTLQIFDVKSRAWSRLPMNGSKLPAAYCDATGICYDSKRDCLWLANSGSPMMRYDMKTGEVTAESTPGRPENIWMRETAYIPECDMLLNAGRVNGPDGQTGNLAYDIENKRWIGLRFPCGDGQPRINDKPYSEISLSLHYDPKLRIAVFHSNTQEILVSRIDKAALKTFEVKMQAPKK